MGPQSTYPDNAVLDCSRLLFRSEVLFPVIRIMKIIMIIITIMLIIIITITTTAATIITQYQS